MSTTTQDVLLSDSEYFASKETSNGPEYLLDRLEIRRLYEAERQERIQREAKLLDLLQQGVDAMTIATNFAKDWGDEPFRKGEAFLTACKDVGIVPSQD